ncbi:hypothetical protein Agub_g11453 [Astrephomene gubernaculifera]|uniref:Uncharacterized protein n=1 Tax=Astrephomene gubernaculifera TaxID=47775 RepID=A0AAD3HQP1_9CHLO|nr:hypothetical protein Agub_g11453 [Astrephomene gubernaculifera]
MTAAERLSRNRSARRAATDLSAVEHINRIYHMHRRIEEHYSRTERHQDPWDPSAHPVYLRRNTHAYQDMLKEEIAAWRPTSAPAWARSEAHPCVGTEASMLGAGGAAAVHGGGAAAARGRCASAGRKPVTSCGGGGGGGGALSPPCRPRSARAAARRGDSYAGWSVGQSLPASFPKSSYSAALATADRAAYRSALLGEVLSGRLYREADLRRLFAAYIRLAPLGDRRVVEEVVGELKRELDVRD